MSQSSSSVSQLNDLLKEKLQRYLTQPTRLKTAIPSLVFNRHDSNVSAVKCFYYPMMALVVQGFKRSMIGGHEANYGPCHCVTIGVDMLGVFNITEASPEKPFLSLSIKLDRQIITQLISTEPDIMQNANPDAPPVVVDQVSPEIMQAFVRLLDLLETPSRIPVLAPMILREIHYYLLCGPQGSCLKLFNTTGTQAHQIAQAISWLRLNYTSTMDMVALAQSVNMAPSTFNRHFKKVTSLSPLQFQKRLRLYEAERLMLLEGKDAGTAALMVGYESASQFNREYKRQFGAPPHTDIANKMQNQPSA